MKSAGPLKHFIFAFAIALVLYVIFYNFIEHRRTRRGPWRATFTTEGGVPALIVNEPQLGISNVTMTFPNERISPTNLPLVFAQPQPVPFDVPFGKCLFMDTTFQPGTVVFNLFGHEIQLIPRVLTIDRIEFPWQSHTTIALTNRVTPADSLNKR